MNALPQLSIVYVGEKVDLLLLIKKKYRKPAYIPGMKCEVVSMGNS